jgi:hypothetical protein
MHYSDEYFEEVLEKLLLKATERDLIPITYEQLDRLCERVWTLYNRDFLGRPKKGKEHHRKELCEACHLD